MFENLKPREKSIIDYDLYEHYSISIPYIEETDEILFQVRSNKLRKQPGEISFPGGRIEKGENPKEAALRELREECSIGFDNYEYIASLDTLITSYYTIVYSHLVKLKNYKYSYCEDEVDSVFTVPFEYFLNSKPGTYKIEVQTSPKGDFPYELIPNGENYKWGTSKYPVLFYQYEEYVIWGMTAKFIDNLVKIYKNS